ncbi:MAG: helix-turn-helix transcriptional regulator [Candidatus Tectomicrobia bacterium]|nr:helix-turn-helix transcriptional regulator [Candidatus Tectomicrobia bacterium]
METVGKKIREHRNQKGLTLKEVSQRTGLAISFISQVERGNGNPTLSSLRAIAQALGVTVGYFFHSPEEEPPPSVVHEAERKVLIPRPGVAYQLLTSRLAGRAQFMHVIFEPGSTTGEAPIHHEGEEYILVLKGRMALQLGRERYDLKKGDSFSYPSTVPHAVMNAGRGRLECIWVVTPPSF